MIKTCIGATLVAALIAWPMPSPAQSGPDLVHEGNALARDGLYHAALLRYREAAAAGTDTPLLHYNLGVVYYRLKRYDDAARELGAARVDPALEPLATFNLALVERARGDTAAALAAYTAVVDLGAPRPLRRAARDAITALSSGSSEPVAEAAGSGATARTEVAPGLRVSALARYATDSNVYRAPADPYTDLSDPAAPVVTPTVYSASFVPVDLLAAYVLPNEAGDTDFVFGYAMNGDFYDAEFSNATRVSQRFSIGADIDMPAESERNRSLSSSFYVRTHDETNFNPDDGLDRSLAGTDIADRLSYSGAGIRADYRHERGRYRFGFDIDYERRQYRDAGLLPNYDHDYLENRAFADFEINSRSEIGLGLNQLRRRYDERRARELTGALSTAGIVDYAYRGVDLSFRRLFGSALIAEFRLSRLARRDRYVGYYDYEQRVGRLRLVYRPNPRLRIGASLAVQQYDFPRAFAFNNPLAGERQLDVTRADIDFEYELTRRLALHAALSTDNSTSTDAREAYDRSVVTVGVEWRRD